MIASVVRTWTLDRIPDELYENMASVSNEYTPEKAANDIQKEYIDGLFAKRLSDFKEVLGQIKNDKLTPNDIK